MKEKIGVVSLGCDKNRVDTEVMLGYLKDGGYQITADPSDADVIIINTCAFLESSRKESIDTILEMADFKTQGKCQKVIVTGCLGQKFGSEVLDGMDEVDAVVGTDDYAEICNIVAATLGGERKKYQNCNTAITFGKRVLTTSPHVAYLKIADGCNNFCTYCLIPYIRGRFRSVPMEKIIAEANTLADGGVKELILVAQDTTKYGDDLYGKPMIVELVKQLSAIEKISWIRLLYCYPELMSDELIEEIRTNEKVVNCVDIPLQHVNDGILKAMNRKSDGASIRALFDKLSEAGVAVRSTFICGFPGETKRTIDEMGEFLLKYKLRNVGFFAYSKEDGTVAAKMENQIKAATKKSYVAKMYKTQQKVVAELNKTDVGKTYKCIVDCLDNIDGDNYVYKARTYYMVPDIDGVVYVISPQKLNVGEFYNVKITNALEYDLIGEVVE